jgi:hypothetical protein
VKSQLKQPVRRKSGTEAMIFCCHGIIYTVTDKVLGADVYSPDKMLDRLRKIDGVKVTEVRGGVGNVIFPTLRLPEVTRVLVPRDSAWAPEALAFAAHRGRIW